MAKKVDQYLPEIKNGDPPERDKTSYNSKMFEGALADVAKRIKPGQYVEDVPTGSLGKLAGLIKERGLRAIRRQRQGESRGTLYVPSDEWFLRNPHEKPE